MHQASCIDDPQTTDRSIKNANKSQGSIHASRQSPTVARIADLRQAGLRRWSSRNPSSNAASPPHGWRKKKRRGQAVGRDDWLVTVVADG